MGIISGMSKRERQARAARSNRLAEKEEKGAREDRRKAAQLRKNLKDSSHPATDRYIIRRHERDARVQEANARGLRESAKTMRKWWS